MLLCCLVALCCVVSLYGHRSGTDGAGKQIFLLITLQERSTQMASRSAGTLITHNNATYIPPALMPGYRGYIPTQSFTYGDTYGNTTARCFQDFRSTALNSSQTPYCKGGQFPTSYSNDPALVISNRSRGWDRWVYSPTWSRYNVDFDRTEELKSFRKVAEQHRDHYRDKTGTLYQVQHFILPVKNEETYPLPQQRL